MFPIRDTTPRRTRPLVTAALIAANAVAFVYELGFDEAELVGFIGEFGVVPARVLRPLADLTLPGVEVYRSLVTSMFLHGGWLHLLANMWALWIFGDNVEDRMGHARYLLFYLVCGVAAAIAHVLFNPGSVVPVVGASGALSGVLGAYLLLFPAARVLTVFPILFWPLFFEVPALIYIGVWFVSQVVAATAAAGAGETALGNVAWWAHIGGFVAGLLLTSRFRRPRVSRS